MGVRGHAHPYIKNAILYEAIITTSMYIKIVHAKSCTRYKPHGGTRPSYQFLYLVYKRTLYRCRAACCCLRGFQYRYVSVIGVVDREKKRPKKTESVFRFRFFWATEKPTLKSRFPVGKNREKTTEKNDFRFSVHK